MLYLFVVSGVLATMLAPASGINCHDDLTLDNLQDYEFDIPHMENDKDVKEYWKNYQQNYILFGEFAGDPTVGTTITAGYYTSSDDLIYSITIDCGAGTWFTHIINNVTKIRVAHENGTLETACQDGALFDVWFHVHQPFLMSWLYGAQALQYGRHETSFDYGLRRHRAQKGAPYSPDETPAKWRTRTTPVPTLYGGDKAGKYKVHTTGAAVVTRLAFGKCVAWPEQMSSNCTAAEEWVVQRSKKDPNDPTDPVFAGEGNKWFGAVNHKFAPDCRNTIYFDNIQKMVKPDQDSVPKSSYCCCVDMTTGKIYEDDPATWCQINLNNSCRQTCQETYDPELWIETE